MNLQRRLRITIGQASTPVGQLDYIQQGQREHSLFAYDVHWLQSPDGFNVSPDLVWQAGHQVRKPPTAHDSRFFLALADTEPDAWGRRVIARAHAKARQHNPALAKLTELDYLCAVDDHSRVGALRLQDEQGRHLGGAEAGQRHTPPLIELDRALAASQAIERKQESEQDLRYLLGKGTSLGGMRPKCTVVDEDGHLALGKFPSISDDRCVTRGEILALTLARRAGIQAAEGRVVLLSGQPIALIRRFDRTGAARIPYLSAASLLQSARGAEHSYTEVVDAMHRHGLDPAQDAQALWRRLAYNHLITNVDDHLNNLGFLYAGNGQWALAPAFDLNPFPDKAQSSKTWLSEDTGPITDVSTLLAEAPRFHLSPDRARQVLREVVHSLDSWREVATSAEVGMSPRDVEDFAPAFDHIELDRARQLS
jgi:serine/threonine-protein kinase HipA